MAEVIEADCVEAMREMDEASVDAIVTDPPYGLGFMGKEWDDLPPGDQFATEALRVLKPGGHLLAFGGTRTYHRLACAIEDAGFEIRDCLAWLYGSGFPKSLDVSKAIDKAAGAEREVEGTRKKRGARGGVAYAQDEWTLAQANQPLDLPITAPATPEAQHWNGWGTALKPAHEPIVLARKSLIGTVAANVQAHGTGALNVDGCRIEGARGDGVWGSSNAGRDPSEVVKLNASPGREDFRSEQHPGGRWPANVTLDPEAAAMLDEQSGERPGGNYPEQRSEAVATGFGRGQPTPGGARSMDDTGGASRFFYCAKASRGERNAGLDGFEERPGPSEDYGTKAQHPMKPEGEPNIVLPVKNHHPTVKPIALMRWLCRLVTPPGGLILDPFLGSGTTGCAAVLEGFEFVGIEREPEYAEIARARIEHWAAHPVQMGLLDG